MNGQDQIKKDIKERARDLLIQQKEVIIRTIPSTRFPKGAKYSGYIFDVLDNKIILNDTYINKRIEIFISEICSPADIWEKNNE